MKKDDTVKFKNTGEGRLWQSTLFRCSSDSYTGQDGQERVFLCGFDLPFFIYQLTLYTDKE